MMVIFCVTNLLKNCCFFLIFHSKLEEDFLYMAYADITAKVNKFLILMVKYKNLHISQLK